MTPQPNPLADALVAASSVASLIVDAHGALVSSHPDVCELLECGATPASLRDVVDNYDSLDKAFARARRGSGPLPYFATTTKTNRRLRLDVKPLVTTPGRPASWLLVEIRERGAANSAMIKLTRQLKEQEMARQQLRARNDQLEQTISVSLPRLRKLSYTDALTGVRNRRYFDEQLTKEWSRAMRHGKTLSLVYIDIDHFKAYNDTAGHPAGDVCLQEFSATLRDAVTREFDRTCRIGGEEFALLLPMTDRSGAFEVAQRSIEAIRNLALPHPADEFEMVTASFGVGTAVPNAHVELETFVSAVDNALYQAKAGGRDRIAVATGLHSLGGRRQERS